MIECFEITVLASQNVDSNLHNKRCD
uniref:Uncharacterized protein n=1 Tax=Arundo donax TaxID=35708 RepID=A0A0A8YXA4_ARUDO